ncbi:MAG: imidazole glycerol phosphate synthase subunit HisH [Lachnospiraceae bacterium]|nr:imidazole glycerol phosphate synthase subunit HisH [Lachnospiraceae bacterium]
MKSVSVIDYDAGNTMSVMNALKSLGVDVTLTNDPAKLIKAEHVIFPGVGAYADSMNKLKEYKLVEVVKEMIAKDTPFLGICLGMQMLFEKSHETIGSDSTDAVEGLGILRGSVKGFKELPDFSLKVPHMGWNSIDFAKKDCPLYKDIPNGSYVYFVHSFYLDATDRENVATTTDYGISFDSSVSRGNVFGCQFHPEKSGDVGLQILKNFCDL